MIVLIIKSKEPHLLTYGMCFASIVQLYKHDFSLNLSLLQCVNSVEIQPNFVEYFLGSSS